MQTGAPLYPVAALREAERAALETLPEGTLMARAGAAAAEVLLPRLGGACEVLVACGPGNNGGDGYELARHLLAAGHAVRVWPVLGPPPPRGDAAAARDRFVASGGRIQSGAPTAADTPAWVVDALFGIGLSRPPDGPALGAVAWMQATAARVCALDVPSGLDADTGQWVGGIPGVFADLTVTFIGDKPGLHTGAGCDAVGVLVVAPLGVTLQPSLVHLNGPAAFAPVCAPRPRDSHKGRFGNLRVLGGQDTMVGAALLAARAGLRLGAGRVFVSLLGAGLPGGVDPLQPELMFRPPEQEVPIDALVAGCGAGDSRRTVLALEGALAAPVPLVLDADGLNCVARDAGALQALGARNSPTVLTPHPLEAARLLGLTVQDVQRDRVAAARRLAARTGAVVVLKGAGTVIVEAQRAWINTTGGPALASAGTGDVLAGMIGALLAQGHTAGDAARAATWLHGQAADRFGADVGLAAGDVAALAARELAALRVAGRSPNGRR